jgi:hypothetical protein
VYTVQVNRRFGGHRLHFQGKISRAERQPESRWQADLEAICSAETSVDFQRSTRRYVPEGKYSSSDLMFELPNEVTERPKAPFTGVLVPRLSGRLISRAAAWKQLHLNQ